MTTDVTTIAIDIGSVRCGMVAGVAAPALMRCAPIDVDADDLDAAVAVVMSRVRTCQADRPVRVVMEHGALYIRREATPQEAQATAVAWTTCDKLCDRIAAACIAAGVPLVTRVDKKGKTRQSIPRATWAHRLVLHHRGGITQAQVRAAVRANLDAASLDLIRTASEGYRNDDDAIDAAGVWLWAVLPPAPRVRRIRRRRPGEAAPVRVKRAKMMPRERWREQKRRQRKLPSAEQRLAVGCACRGKHVVGCVLRKPPKARGYSAEAVERARAALAGMMPPRRAGA